MVKFCFEFSIRFILNSVQSLLFEGSQLRFADAVGFADSDGVGIDSDASNFSVSLSIQMLGIDSDASNFSVGARFPSSIKSSMTVTIRHSMATIRLSPLAILSSIYNRA